MSFNHPVSNGLTVSDGTTNTDANVWMSGSEKDSCHFSNGIVILSILTAIFRMVDNTGQTGDMNISHKLQAAGK